MGPSSYRVLVPLVPTAVVVATAQSLSDCQGCTLPGTTVSGLGATESGSGGAWVFAIVTAGTLGLIAYALTAKRPRRRRRRAPASYTTWS